MTNNIITDAKKMKYEDWYKKHENRLYVLHKTYTPRYQFNMWTLKTWNQLHKR